MRAACSTAKPSSQFRRCLHSRASLAAFASFSFHATSRAELTHSMNSSFSEGLRELAATAERVVAELGPDLDRALAMVQETVQRHGTLFFCGNGGSAADAQHMATEYVVRYMRNRRAYPAVALTTDTSLLTAAGNDIGFEQVFARQVEALARRGDLLIIHSTSGNSPNVLRAAEAAR